MGTYGSPERFTVEADNKSVKLIEKTTTPQGQAVRKVIVMNRRPITAGSTPQITGFYLFDDTNQREICAAQTISEVQRDRSRDGAEEAGPQHAGPGREADDDAAEHQCEPAAQRRHVRTATDAGRAVVRPGPQRRRHRPDARGVAVMRSQSVVVSPTRKRGHCRATTASKTRQLRIGYSHRAAMPSLARRANDRGSNHGSSKPPFDPG